MVVDDNCDYADALCEVLALASDWEIKAAYSVRTALESAMMRRPDAMLLDLDIPPSNGFEAADALEQAFPGNLPVLLAVSGNTALLKLASRDVRFSQVALKPADPGRLIGWLSGLLPGSAP
jgi:CheY-like chemotaxis protein